MEISLSFPFEGKRENFASHSNPHSGNSGFIVAGDVLLFGFLGRRRPDVPIHARQSFFPFFFPFFILFSPFYIALPCSCPPPSPAERGSPALHIVLLFPCCATLLCAVAAAK